MYYSKKYNLLPGDRIVEPIFQTGFSKHHAIYLGIDQNGIEWISENHKFKGVRLVKASDYFKTGKKYRIETFQGDAYQREAAVKRALSRLGQPYDLFRYNCEHHASYVQTGKKESKQILNAVAIAIGILLIGLAARD